MESAKRDSKKIQKDIFRFKGLSPNEIGEGSDLTVRGIPSRRAPERQRWTFPSHTIISALRLSTVFSHTQISTQSQPTRFYAKKKTVFSENNAYPGLLFFFYLFKPLPHLCWLSFLLGVCSAPFDVILHREKRENTGSALVTLYLYWLAGC